MYDTACMSQYSQSHKAQTVRATIHTAHLMKSEIVICIIHSTRRDARRAMREGEGRERERDKSKVCSEGDT